MTSSARRAVIAALLSGVMSGGAPPAATGEAANPADGAQALEAAARAAIAGRFGRPAGDVRLVGASGPWPGEPGDSLVAIVPAAGGWFGLKIARGDAVIVRRVRALVRAEVTTARKALAAGERLAAADLGRETRWLPADAAEPSVAAEGWEVRRAIAAGEVLRWPAVAPPVVIEPGQRVMATWTRGDVRIRHAATALQGARAGRPVRIRLDGTATARQALALAPGEVGMTGGTK